MDVIDLLGIYMCLTKFSARYEAATGKIKVLSTVVGMEGGPNITYSMRYFQLQSLLLSLDLTDTCTCCCCLLFVVVCVGWGVTEVVATRVVPLWVDAKGVEFSWNSLQIGLDTNITMVCVSIVTCTLYIVVGHII